MLFRTILVLFLSITCNRTVFADDSDPYYFEMPLDDETSISITQFGKRGDRILWIPTEFGIQQQHEMLLNGVASLGHEIWLANLHESYFLPFGRKSYTQVPVTDIASLIEKSLPADKRKLFVVSTGRGAALALMALNQWQQTTADIEKLGGLIMIHPNVQADTPKPGIAMQYLPMVDSTQLPVFIIQPQKSEKYWHLNALVSKLSDSGSQVYTQVIEQASDGYHVRPDANETEKQLAKRLPAQISRATQLLAQTEVTVKKRHSPSQTWQLSTIPESLQDFPGNIEAPSLVLYDTQGKQHDLQTYRGRVVLINFWATWCPPCVEEIPSLGRLQQAFSKDELLVISVDIGESEDEVATFLAQFPADFPVLLNPDGSVFKRWKVTAFPTTFVINRSGIIELAYYGALEWDNPEVIRQLKAVTDDQ